MSWVAGALQGAAGLTDMASTVAGIVYQQQHVQQLRRQNDLQFEWMQRNERLQREAMEMSRDLAANAPSLRVKAALDAGFDPVSARRLAGSGERVISGYLDRPIQTIGEASAQRSTGHLGAMNATLSVFQNGTQFGMRQPAHWGPPPSSLPGGFSNPNYKPVVHLGPRPPISNV